jgi:asparagine synthase (glutamine-hydrolysing)
MCGIVGIISNEPKGIRNALDLLHHRGPDASGIFEDQRMIFGHTRLAVIDLSEGGNQPQLDRSGRYVITFNGEIFNFKELKSKLTNYDFRTSSDTEVILAAYMQWGKNCPKFLKGQFAFAIWDRHEKELFIARDRLGEKPLYYYHDDQKFVFASEIRALLTAACVTPRINKYALAEFLKYQCVHPPNTLLCEIFQVQPATYAILKDHKLNFETYWDPTEKKPFDFSDVSATKTEIKQRLSTAVGLQMESDVPLGAFLSGGIDSSAIVALMAEHTEGVVNTFSIGFQEQQYDETIYAAIVAKKFKTNHQRIEIQVSSFRERIPEILSKVDNPSGDGPNTFLVSEAVKKAGMTVALSGLGGDELFAGYEGFKRFFQLQANVKLWNGSYPLRILAASLFQGKKRDLLCLKNCNLDQVYPLDRKVFLDRQVAGLLDTEGVDQLQLLLLSRASKLQGLPKLSQYTLAELWSYTSQVLLKDTDQMSMANSLEVRVPFFDHDLIDYVVNVPDQIKFPKYAKSLLVESLAGLLPNEIVHRPKMGFSFPWAQWMKSELKPFCNEQLDALSKRGILNETVVQDYWKKFLAGDPTISWSKIWLLVTLEQWMKNIGL